MFFNALPGLQNDLKHVSSEMEKLLPSEWNQGRVGEVVQAVLAGRGKGYRPSLLLLMARIGPNYSACKERLYRLGALVEFVHMASLIHDDIIDDSVLRRGKPTIQARFGKETAVFSGDLILGQVMSILLKDGMRESGILIAGTVQDMCRGEITQSDCRYRSEVSQEEYYANIYGKTASMFVTVCKIGGLESGCSEEMIEKLGEIGLHLGYLFQIRDDLLDFLPKNEEDGKPVRMDFREGVLTLPVIYTLEKAEFRPEMEELIKSAKEDNLSKEQLDRLDQLILKADGFKRTVEAAERHRSRIKELLSELPKGKEVKAISHLISLLSLPVFS
ncbi:MAG: polyprenyl synthetase family protein [Lachnospiraceae bacterium]|nr:polyprenyl synthetase family protein [Lachnospiraceae bacterium]